MEGPDGFVRTIEDGDNVPSDADSQDSALEFASANDKAGPTPSFFEATPAAAWDFASARRQAQELRPFQTSVDVKIRQAAEEAGIAPPPRAGGDGRMASEDRDDSGNEADGSGDANGVKGKTGETSGENEVGGGPADGKDDGSDDDDCDDDGDDGDHVDAKVPGKKRLRKQRKVVTPFHDLHLSKPLQKAVQVLDWATPTPIQSRAIPYILAGRDICASAVTGSGKTAAFLLPVLERLLQAGIDNATRVLILLPTRELAAQCHAVLTSLAKYTSVRAALAVGGLCGESQQVALRARPHIIVATPGRLIDHVHNSRGFSLEDIEVLVMDEADRLLELGFQTEVEEIVRNTPAATRQTLLFSATITPGLKALIKLSLQNPITLAVDPVLDVATTLEQEFVKLKGTLQDSKDAVLLALASRTFKTRTIIFFRQKVTAHRFKILFGLTKLNAAELHGNLTQAQRLAALDSFREGGADFLLCTDLAARGLDIAGVETVINFDVPNEVKEYVHRVGRTARAGNKGRACSLVCSSVNDERKLLKAVVKRANGKLKARVVPPAIIGKWKAWIESVEPAVRKVLKEERHEHELRKAEMEVNKANNLIKHSNEIYSRPAKTWFMSEGQKKAEQGKIREQLGLPPTAREKARNDWMTKKSEDIADRKRHRELAEKEKGSKQQRLEARKSKRQRVGKRR